MTVDELFNALRAVPGSMEVVMMDGHQIGYTSIQLRVIHGTSLGDGTYKVAADPYAEGTPLLEITWPEVGSDA